MGAGLSKMILPPGKPPDMADYWDKMHKDQQEHINLLKTDWMEFLKSAAERFTGLGEVLKPVIDALNVKFKSLTEKIDETTGKIPLPPMFADDADSKVKKVTDAIEDLLNRAQSIAALGDLVGKGILDKIFESEIMREKIKIIGELMAKIRELEALPMNTERLGQITKLAQAYEDLTKAAEGASKQTILSFEEQFDAAIGFGAKMDAVFDKMGDKTLKTGLGDAVLQCVDTFWLVLFQVFQRLSLRQQRWREKFCVPI